MARSQGPRHRMPKKGKTGATTVVLTAAVLAGAVIQLSSDNLTCCSHRSVGANPALATLVEWGIPGTEGTSFNPPAQVPDSPLDSGIWNTVPVDQRRALLDKNLYPAVLGMNTKITFSDGTTRVITGQNSIDMGAAALLAGIEQDLTLDPNTVELEDAGSQGPMVVIKMLIMAKAKGIDLSNIFIALYSNPYTKGTGFIDRFTPSQWALTTGIKGGAPSIPEGPTVVIVNHENDPMAHMFKYLYMAPVGVLNAVLGWYEHGDLLSIDWWNPLNKVEVNGNVTTYTIKSKVVPLLLPLVAAGFVSGISKERMYALLKPLNDILEPLVKMTGTDDPGKFALFPTPKVFARQVAAVLKGIFIDAPKDIVKLLTGKPVFAPEPVGGLTPTQQLIKDAYDREQELTGGVVSTTATTTSFAAAKAEPQADFPASQPTVASVQSEDVKSSDANKQQLEVQSPTVQQQAQEPTPKEETPKSTDPSDNAKSDVPKVDASSSVHVTEQNDQQDQDASDKKPDEPKKKRPVSHRDDSDAATSSQHQSTTTVHHQSEDTDDSSSQSSPKPKVHMPTGKHDSEQGASASGSGHSTSSDTSGGNES